MDPEQATVVAISTAGRAVLFAGTTVVISVLGMLLMNLPFLQGVAVGSAAVGARHHDRRRSPCCRPCSASCGTQHRQAGKVPFVGRSAGRPPGRVLVPVEPAHPAPARGPSSSPGCIAVLLLAAPVFSLRLGFPGDESVARLAHQPPGLRPVRRGLRARLRRSPASMVVELPGAGRARRPSGQLESGPAHQPGVAAATPARLNAAGDAAVVTVFPTTGGQSEETVELVNRLRHDVIPRVVAGTGVEVSVGGPNASSSTRARRSPTGCRSSSRWSSGCRSCC